MLGLNCRALPGVVNVHDGVANMIVTGNKVEVPMHAMDDDALLTQHPALPSDMLRLSAKFDETADAAWVRRMQDNVWHLDERAPVLPNMWAVAAVGLAMWWWLRGRDKP